MQLLVAPTRMKMALPISVGHAKGMLAPALPEHNFGVLESSQ
jgi:hypothetical protein